MQALAGVLLALAISCIALLTRTLSRGGAIAAAVLGSLVFGLGGWPWAVLMLTFFTTSTLLSRSMGHRGTQTAGKYAKGYRRDAGQVIGNGGAAAILVVLHGLFPHCAWIWLGYAASLAAVNADTWATELGVLAPGAPRLITHLGKRVEKGTSGAISITGTLAALLGSGLIAILAAGLPPPTAWPMFWAVLAGGLFGTMFDSILGATVQAIYTCPTENVETEQHPLHACGSPTVLTRGWSWLNNDWVNFACGASGAIAAAAVSLALNAS